MMSGVAPAHDPDNAQRDVKEFWESLACGEVYARGVSDAERLAAHAATRYRLEPYIPAFARFADGRARDVLEIGVGLGADLGEWAKHRPRRLVGVDFTERALALTGKRLAILKLPARLVRADAERLPFVDGSFDIVYSWGVLHHSPDTASAIREVARVLRPSGTARIMIYQRHSVVGWLLWARYALLRGSWALTLDEVYSRYLESPGTKAYTIDRATALFGDFRAVTVTPQLSFADLLLGAAGQRHQGRLLDIARRIWPRALIRRFLARRGLFLLISAEK